MKSYQNKKGLWQSVDDNQIDFAKEKASGGLQLLTINDFYKGQKIIDVTFENNISEEIINKIGTNQAILFWLSPVS